MSSQDQARTESVCDEVDASWRRPVRRRRLRFGSALRRAVVGLALSLVLGNGLIMLSSTWFRATAAGPTLDVSGIDNLRRVDDRLIRGAAPSEESLRQLAAMGVTTVVDLRAEADLAVDEAIFDELEIERHHLPIRDGQLPTEAQAMTFLEILEDATGTVLVHCGAGVGRTGAMAGFYLNATGETHGTGALRHNLSVGPPSLEQIAFSVSTASGDYQRPGLAVTAASRVLDAPRRIWHFLS